MTEAQKVVDALLEAIPLGFNAKRDDGDEVEWRYDPNAHVYRWTKWWDDPDTRKREVLLNGMSAHPAHFKLDREMQKYRDAGWTVTLLES